MTDHILDSISYRLYQENILIEIQNLIMEKYELLSDTFWVVKVTKCM